VISDVYIWDDAIYLLCATFGNEYTKNTIIKIVLKPKMEIACIYNLPSEVYDSFCTDGTHIYAFNHIGNKLERFKIGK
jgi:hypothetical protein